MRVLYLAQRVPFPPDRGDKIITFNQVRHLARRHQVVVCCLAEDDADLRNAEALREIGCEVHAVRLSPLRARLRALWSLLTGRPFTLGYFDEPQLRRIVDGLLSEGGIHAAIVFCSGMAQFVEVDTRITRLLHLADMDSQKWRQYASAGIPPMRWVYAAEAARLLEYERRLARTFDHCFLSSRNEVKDFERLVGTGNVSYLANGVDLDYFQPQATPDEAASLVFTGVMDYPPNIDGVNWFCREVFPLVRQRLPQARFTICGARPTRAVLELAALGGVTVTGRVPDVRPYLAGAAVAVAPLRIARGVQNKVLEAMAMARPVVATSAAFNGIDAVGGIEVLLADDAATFADQVCALLGDPRRRAAMGSAARCRIEANYRWEVPLAEVERLLLSIAGARQVTEGVSVSRVHSPELRTDR